MNNIEKEAVVFYHKDCSDGFSAAWSAWKKMGESALYIPSNHNDDPNINVRGSRVYLLDLCFRPEVIERLKGEAVSLTIIDHHKSSAEWVKLATTTIFDLKHSGAVLSWNFFHPGKKIPNLLLYVEDIDIWKWKLRSTDEIMEYSTLVPMEFKAWNRFAKGLETPKTKKDIINAGKILVRDREARVKKLLEIGAEGMIDGHKALIVNSPVTIDHTSKRIYSEKTGNPATTHPVAIIWSRRHDKIVVSLRSNETVDVSEIAQKRGGGGHPRSSAFTLPPNDFKTILEFYK
ncbi:MAG: hypothetical protein HZA95_01845 [Candidatus Vogelbacteria bacterium]|nr:hypothetical protein [Candidatus Vogelbacteria bacterium]